MAEKILNFFRGWKVFYPRSVFDLSPIDLGELEEVTASGKTVGEALQGDWVRIGEDFRSAFVKYERERHIA